MRTKGLIVGLLLLLLAAPVFGAGLNGDWHFVFDTEAGVREADMTLQVKGREVFGKIRMPESAEEAPEVKGTFQDGQVSLDFPYYSEDAGFQSTVRIQGKLDGDKISGDWQFDQHKGTFTATRTR
jgi:hypothetical protein